MNSTKFFHSCAGRIVLHLHLALAVAAVLFAANPGIAQTPTGGRKPIASLDELRALRHRAADRPRRIIFNSFDPASPLWRELGDPRGLAKLDKDYFGSVRGVGNAAGGNLPLDPYVRLETLNPARPKNVPPGGKATATLRLGDDFGQTSPVTPKLRLQFAAPPQPLSLRVSTNGQALDAPTIAGGWLEFTPPATALRRGANRVEVALAADAPTPATWTDVMLHVRFSGVP